MGEQLKQSAAALDDVETETLTKHGYTAVINQMKFIRNKAREEAMYLEMRCNKREKDGRRHINEGYAKLTKVKGWTKQQLNCLELSYSDGTRRHFGDWMKKRGDVQAVDLEAGECIAKLEIWNTKDKNPAKGMKFTTSNGKEIEFQGS